jgi:hypothetical protein
MSMIKPYKGHCMNTGHYNSHPVNIGNPGLILQVITHADKATTYNSMLNQGAGHHVLCVKVLFWTYFIGVQFVENV